MYLQENGRGLVEALPQNLLDKQNKTVMTDGPDDIRAPLLPITIQERHCCISPMG
jgi:hypothetical protein